MRDLFDGTPNLANKRQPVIAEPSVLQQLRAQRQNRIDRIKPNTAGVTELRARLKQITHLIMRLELAK